MWLVDRRIKFIKNGVQGVQQETRRINWMLKQEQHKKQANQTVKKQKKHSVSCEINFNKAAFIQCNYLDKGAL